MNGSSNRSNSQNLTPPHVVLTGAKEIPPLFLNQNPVHPVDPVKNSSLVPPSPFSPYPLVLQRHLALLGAEQAPYQYHKRGF